MGHITVWGLGRSRSLLLVMFVQRRTAEAAAYCLVLADRCSRLNRREPGLRGSSSLLLRGRGLCEAVGVG